MPTRVESAEVISERCLFGKESEQSIRNLHSITSTALKAAPRTTVKYSLKTTKPESKPQETVMEQNCGTCDNITADKITIARPTTDN
ncbi:unnamed protein product [Thelazia callipaeda]|uniref:Uncharacterized protein n=1 Tax=Thelazia callipaeda TaxID=103827 RepID=A0A0N5CLQ1_THECL|nr:unnamed protein product [Thelazia callipaeda]